MHVVLSVLHHLLSASNLPKIFSSLSCKVPSISCAPHVTSSKLLTAFSHPQNLPALECLSVVGAGFGIQATLYSSGCRPPGNHSARGPRESQHVKIWYAAISHSCFLISYKCFASHQNCRPIQNLTTAAKTAANIPWATPHFYLEPRPPSLKFRVYIFCWASFPCINFFESSMGLCPVAAE